jgi:hypothetical protein
MLYEYALKKVRSNISFLAKEFKTLYYIFFFPA